MLFDKYFIENAMIEGGPRIDGVGPPLPPVRQNAPPSDLFVTVLLIFVTTGSVDSMKLHGMGSVRPIGVHERPKGSLGATMGSHGSQLGP